MIIQHYQDVSAEPLEDAEASGVLRRIVIGEPEGAPNFIMRIFTVAPGGHTPHHHHEIEHEVFIVHGNGIVLHQGKEYPVKPGDVLFIPGGDDHQFQNIGRDPLEFICVVPKT